MSSIAADYGQPNEHSGVSFVTDGEAQLECALTFITAHGANSAAQTTAYLADRDDAQILSEILREGWLFPAGTDMSSAMYAIHAARELTTGEA